MDFLLGKTFNTLSWGSDLESMMRWHRIISVLGRRNRNFKETHYGRNLKSFGIQHGIIQEFNMEDNSFCMSAGGYYSSEQCFHITESKPEPQQAGKKDS